MLLKGAVKRSYESSFQAVRSVLSELEGLGAFQDLMTNTAMKSWQQWSYDRVKLAVQTRAGAHTVWQFMHEH